MMKRMISFFLALMLICTLPVFASAESFTGKSGLKATYTKDGKMVSNFSSDTMADDISNLQPGDDITFTITLKNENKSTVDWYMLNEILTSMEDNGTASGGAYDYVLTYISPTGSKRVLFDSKRVGGKLSEGDTSGVGLYEVDSALKEYFYLDTMRRGKSATIKLKVILDGESQVNSYQDSEASLRMRFAVESRAGKTVVQTADSRNLAPFYIVMAISGAVFLLLAMTGRKQKKREEEHV